MKQKICNELATDKTINFSTDELLKLDNQLCFALYVSSKEVIRKYKPLLDPLGLTYTGYITLMALWEKDDVTVKTLGKRLYLDSGTLTPLLKKLESLGYLERTRSVSDERNVYVKLTPKGYELKSKVTHIPQNLICSSNIDVENALQLLPILHQFMKQIAD
ncbi:MarR family winged helix-turn-helix transcriptional regulator [Pelosinus sp. sgz500959]|uniref:MarR family winged helix-turn-helix transcriptional regulator n=1 Tax=Pelosinus sp. sgz500959 TaxID=3242472 RepID=UPI00366BE118